MAGRRLGFIGLGAMGFPMASRLAAAGFPLTVYDIRRETLESFSAKGALLASSPTEVADEADIVLVSLPSPRAAQEAALGELGVVHGKRAKIYIDLSTTGEHAAGEIGRALMARGIQVLDCPVSGGVAGAQQGTLSLMAAGDQAIYDECYSILSCIGSKIFYIGGKVGQAQAMKVINNLLSTAALAITSEAMVVGAKAGLDPDVMIDVLNASSGRNSATMDKFKRSVLNRKFDYGFKTGLAYKDLKLYLELAEKLDVPTLLGGIIGDFWKLILTQGGEHEDNTCVIKYMEQWAGVEVRGKEVQV